MIERIFYLLGFIVGQIEKLLKRKEQREAQDERDKIDDDSAQYAADRFGDGRVRDLNHNAREADSAERTDGDGG